MWDEKYQHRAFLSLSMHFINNNWELASKLLGVEEFPEIMKTTNNIREECKRILSQYFPDNVDEVLSNSVAVTDGGKNIVNVFYQRLPCMCHLLNTITTWMFNEKRSKVNPEKLTKKQLFIFWEECPGLHGALSAAKDIVTYVKQAKINLTYTLKQEVPTRWNSKLVMLESIVKSQEEIKQALFAREQYSRIESINFGLINQLLEYLKPFRDCTEVWSKDKEPTIHEVVLWINTLKAHAGNLEEDSDEMEKLKEQTRRCFSEYLDGIDDIYYLACVLNPRYRKLKFVDEDKRQRVYERLRSMIDFNNSQLLQEPQQSTTELTESQAPEPKKSKFSLYEDSSESEEEAHITHELDRYLEYKLPKGENNSLLKFWKEATWFPQLRAIAQQVLAIPASQTSDERVFSTTGATVTAKRTELNGDTLSELTFVHKNCDLS